MGNKYPIEELGKFIQAEVPDLLRIGNGLANRGSELDSAALADLQEQLKTFRRGWNVMTDALDIITREVLTRLVK